MSITAAELIAYASTSRPIDDVSTTGGAIDSSGVSSAPGVRPVFTQFSSGAKLSLTSDGADTRVTAVTGRLADGSYATENVTLTGAVEVLSSNTYERILTVVIASGSATRTVTMKQGASGTTIGTIPVNETGVCAMFINSASSSGGAVARYEKFFWYNSDATLALTSATVTLTADPSSKINIGLAGTLGDTATVANRLAAPGGISFSGTSVALNVANSQSLSAVSKQGVWVKQSLLINDAALKSTFTTSLNGNTT